MRSIRIAAASASLLALGAIAIVGCGGNDDTSTTTAAISKDDFITQGNQICAEGNKAFNAAAQEAFSGGKPTDAEMSKFVDETVVPTVQGQIDDLRALGVPAGDEDQVNAILDAAQSGVDALEADPTLFSSGSGDPFAEANKLANDYGLTECGG